MVCKWRELEFEPTHVGFGCGDDATDVQFEMRPVVARALRAAWVAEPSQLGVLTIRIDSSVVTATGRLHPAHSKVCTRQDTDPHWCDCCSFVVCVPDDAVQVVPHDAAGGLGVTQGER